MGAAPASDRAASARDVLRGIALAYPGRAWLVGDDDSDPDGGRRHS